MTEAKKKVLTPMQKTYRFMQRVQSIDDMIDRKQEQIDSLRSLATSTEMHTDSERVQSSGAKDKIGDACARIADLQAEINEDIDHLVEMKASVMHRIDELESLDERNVLFYRYFQYYEFRKISQEMHVSESTVYRLHKQAMQGICENMFSNAAQSVS